MTVQLKWLSSHFYMMPTTFLTKLKPFSQYWFLFLSLGKPIPPLVFKLDLKLLF